MSHIVFDTIRTVLDEVEATQMDNIEAAARLEVETFKRGGILMAYGVGHSEGGASEICHRAGGFVPTKKLRDPTFGLFAEVPGAGTVFLKASGIRPEDTLVLISNSGRNSMIIDMAIEAKKKGCGVIVVTSLEASKHLTPKHKDGKNVYVIRTWAKGQHRIPRVFLAGLTAGARRIVHLGSGRELPFEKTNGGYFVDLPADVESDLYADAFCVTVD